MIYILAAFLTLDQGAIILMRHGEQAKSEAVSQLPTAAEQKIAMMRHDENRTAGITSSSYSELEEVLAAFSDQKLNLTIESSENMRAYLPAEWLSKHLHAPLRTRSIWNCIDYLDSLPTAELLQILPDGTVPWEQDKIDRVAGPGTYDKISESVEKELTPGPEIRIIITHTQQIQAACKKLGLPLARLSHYGFVLILENGQAHIYPNGFSGFFAGNMAGSK